MAKADCISHSYRRGESGPHVTDVLQEPRGLRKPTPTHTWSAEAGRLQRQGLPAG